VVYLWHSWATRHFIRTSSSRLPSLPDKRQYLDFVASSHTSWDICYFISYFAYTSNFATRPINRWPWAHITEWILSSRNIMFMCYLNCYSVGKAKSLGMLNQWPTSVWTILYFLAITIQQTTHRQTLSLRHILVLISSRLPVCYKYILIKASAVRHTMGSVDIFVLHSLMW